MNSNEFELMSEKANRDIEWALVREQAARKEAEELLEKKSEELYESNRKLLANQAQLERVVANRTSQLNKASARLTALISGLPSGILVEDEDRRVVLANSIFCELFLLDVKPETLTGSVWRGTEKNAKFLFAEPERFVDITRELLAKRVRQVAVRLDLRDGRILELDFLPLQEGDISRGCMWMYSDVTDRVLAKDALVSAKHTAESANQARGQFLAMMSHEMRTPLSAIIGLSDLANDAELAPKQQTYLSRIYANADSLLHLIDDILDFSKIDAGQVQLHADEYDPTELVQKLGDLMIERCYEKGLELVIVTDPHLPRRVTGDKNRIRQILVNLVVNAIKFTQKGQILVKVENCPETTGTIIYEVVDTGQGIPKQLRPKIFDRFVKHRRRNERNIPGTGLGLSICRSLVQMMGGEIAVDSSEGNGSRFWFRLPHTITDPMPAHVLSTCNSQSIILIDDNETLRIHVTLLLSQLGYKAEAYASLLEASERINTLTPDVLIVDDEAPCISELLSKRSESTQLLALCASGVVELTQLIGEGWSAALPKPVTRKELDICLRRLLHTNNSETEIKEANSPALSLELYVLIVEDDEDNRLMLTHSLTNCGYRVDTACDGQEAISKFSGKEYDAIITDHSMPKMTGMEMATRIRNLESLSGLGHIPIVAVSAHALPGYRERCLLAGMDAYQTKPVDIDMLDRTLRSLVDKRPVILVVDDSEDHQTLLKAYLNSNDKYRCLYVDNGEAALKELEKGRVNLLLLDMMMPGIDGYTVARTLRKMPCFTMLPIIAMTAHSGQEAQKVCFDAGCSAFLQKPIQKTELLGVIDRTLSSPSVAKTLLPKNSSVEEEPSIEDAIEIFLEEDLLDMVPRFLKNRQSDSKNISKFLFNARFDDILKTGHNMKGSGTSYGFEKLSDIGRRLEDAARERDTLTIEELQSELENYLKKVVVRAIANEE